MQNPRLLCKGGRRRWEKSDKMGGHSIKLSEEKGLTNFRIKSIKNLWILKDGKMVSTEMWESKSRVGDHPIVRIKGRAGDQFKRRYPEMWCVRPCISTGRRREVIEGKKSSKCPYRSSSVSNSRCKCG